MLGAFVLTIVFVVGIVWIVHALFKSHNASAPQPNKAADEGRDWLLTPCRRGDEAAGV
jgi:hypothetical protein